MIGVAGGTKSRHFTINLRPARFGAFIFFNHNNSGSVCDHKPIAFTIKRPARTCRFIIAAAQRLHVRKTSHAQLTDGTFGAARQHHIRITTLNHSLGSTNRMSSRGTGRNHAEIRALKVVFDSNQSGSDI